MRSGDASYYGKIFEFFIGIDLSNQLRIHTMLSDIEKDFSDYKEDYQKLPNFFYLYLATKVKKQDIPKNLREAISLIKKQKIDKGIILFIYLIYKESKNLDFSRCITIKKDIENKYNKILEILKKENNLKVIIKETNDLGKNIFQNKDKYSCFTVISMGKKFFSKKNIKLYFQFATEHCKKYLLLICDEVEKWNYMAFKNLNEEEAIGRSIKRGLNYEGAFSRVLNDFDKDKIHIIKFSDLLKQEECKRLLKVLKEYYRKDKDFREDIEGTLWENIGGKLDELKTKLTEEGFNKKSKLLINYVLEEISIIIYVTEFYKGGYPIEIYPGKDIQVKRNIYNKKYGGLYEKLGLKGRRGHIFLNVEDRFD